jgi:hypothetical protein
MDQGTPNEPMETSRRQLCPLVTGPDLGRAFRALRLLSATVVHLCRLVVCMRTAVVISWVALALLTGCGHGRWTEVKPRDGTFVVLMPGQPAEKHSDPDFPVGRPKGVEYTLTTNGMTFDLHYFDYPKTMTMGMSADDLLDHGLKRLFSAYPHDRKQSSRITLQGFPGRSFTIESNGNIIIGRSYWVGQRLYLLQAIMGSGLSLRPEVDRFIRSIRFQPVDGPKSDPSKPIQDSISVHQ